jgi:hypothetical protein
VPLNLTIRPSLYFKSRIAVGIELKYFVLCGLCIRGEFVVRERIPTRPLMNRRLEMRTGPAHCIGDSSFVRPGYVPLLRE